MTFEKSDQSLIIKSVKEITAANAREFKELVAREFSSGMRDIELDASTLKFIDSSGLGALLSLHKMVVPAAGQFRLNRPSPSTMQILTLTRLDRVLQIII